MKYITQLGSTAFSIILPAALLIFGKEFAKITAIHMAIVLLFSQAIVQSIKRVVNRPRPYRSLKQVIAIKPPACKYSFPSGHTCAAFSIAFVLSYSLPVIGLIFLIPAFLVGVSRIYLGFHYPTDVTFGIIIAYISFIVSNILLPLIRL